MSRKLLQLLADAYNAEYDCGEHKGPPEDYDAVLHECERKKGLVNDELNAVLLDAERYQKLRSKHWTDGGYVIAAVGSIKVGSDCPSGERLDAMIDAMPPLTE